MRRAPFTQVTRSLITLSALGALLITLFVAGYTLGASDRTPVSAQNAEQPEETETLFEPFWETWALLHENYVDPLDDEALMEAALRGCSARSATRTPIIWTRRPSRGLTNRWAARMRASARLSA